MAPRTQEVALQRIIACFALGRAGSPRALTDLARQTHAELVGLFIEELDLLRVAALPFAAEVGFASAMRRALDPAALERALRAEAARLHNALAAALGPDIAWSFRVARAAPADALAAALAEGLIPALIIPPGGDPRGVRRVLRRSELGSLELRALFAAAQPALILPE